MQYGRAWEAARGRCCAIVGAICVVALGCGADTHVSSKLATTPSSGPEPEIADASVPSQTQPEPSSPRGHSSPGSTVPSDSDWCASVTQEAESRVSPVDVVWVIDGSASMLDETEAIHQNLTDFANAISGAGIDNHVIMLSLTNVAENTPLGMDAEHYLHVPALVDSHNALEVLLSQYPQYAPFLRSSAGLHLVVVSDDESTLPAADFQTRMEALTGHPFTFHAIASENVNGSACVGACGLPIVCGGFAPGDEYYALADATGGQKISICTADWHQVFGPLQQAVTASAMLPCSYALPPPPRGETLDPDKVNVKFSPPNEPAKVLSRIARADDCGSDSAWFYDDETSPHEVRLCPAACDLASHGGEVQLALGCTTIEPQ